MHIGKAVGKALKGWTFHQYFPIIKNFALYWTDLLTDYSAYLTLHVDQGLQVLAIYCNRIMCM